MHLTPVVVVPHLAEPEQWEGAVASLAVVLETIPTFQSWFACREPSWNT
jgi:hypothetical protein